MSDKALTVVFPAGAVRVPLDGRYHVIRWEIRNTGAGEKVELTVNGVPQRPTTAPE